MSFAKTNLVPAKTLKLGFVHQCFFCKSNLSSLASFIFDKFWKFSKDTETKTIFLCCLQIQNRKQNQLVRMEIEKNVEILTQKNVNNI